jgi:uncharacterized protein (TIGR00299 family) protein
MRVLILDPTFGAAGDMICGALLAAGGDREKTLSVMQSAGVSPEISETVRCGAPALRVITNAGKTRRTLDEVLAVVRKSSAGPAAKELAEKIFLRIHAAEEKVHGSGHGHFHEVGADDAVADVLGCCTAFLSLAADSVFVLPVATGFGTMTCDHGILPVPAPATAEILKNSELRVNLSSAFPGELCTPTGAAVLAEFAASYGSAEPSGRILATGSGAGTRDPEDHPNIVRAVLLASEVSEGRVDVLETNVDDVPGEVLASALPELMKAGARDASLVPIVMKKGRPGYLVRVVCLPADSGRLAQILARETGSLGIRCQPMVHRFAAARSVDTVSAVINGKIYTADVKTGFLEGKPYTRKAEFDQVQEIAQRSGVPVRDVKRIFEEEGWRTEQP